MTITSGELRCLCGIEGFGKKKNFDRFFLELARAVSDISTCSAWFLIETEKQSNSVFISGN
jgi:hypothetical protein